MANSVDPDQTAPSGAVWSGSTLFAYVILSDALVFKFLGHLPYPQHTFSCRDKKNILRAGVHHSISYKIACVPSDDFDQLVHPCSMVRVFAEHSVGSQRAKSVSSWIMKTLESYLGGSAQHFLQDCICTQWVHMQSCRKYCAPVQYYLIKKFLILRSDYNVIVSPYVFMFLVLTKCVKLYFCRGKKLTVIFH